MLIYILAYTYVMFVLLVACKATYLISFGVMQVHSKPAVILYTVCNTCVVHFHNNNKCNVTLGNHKLTMINLKNCH